jgi:hypothetical protein
MNSKTKGDISESVILSYFLRAGKSVSVPFGDNQRYDLLVDQMDGNILRVQCKTGKLTEDRSILRFDTCSSYEHRNGGKKSYREEVDLIAVYSPELDKVYVISVKDIGLKSGYLRIIPTSRKTKNVRLAKDYEFIPSEPDGKAAHR